LILVTLGTHPKPMDRLVVALEDILASGVVDDEIIITAPAYGEQPSRARALGIQPFDVLTEMARTARAMITHGGPASIALAFSCGHIPLVVPRDPAFGEHVDDHQIRFAAWLAERRDITVVLDMADLSRALQETLARQQRRVLEPPEPPQAIERVRAIIADGR
jgi:UDP-N-acetylglucosamine transferase subunit ALG13